MADYSEFLDWLSSPLPFDSGDDNPTGQSPFPASGKTYNMPYTHEQFNNLFRLGGLPDMTPGTSYIGPDRFTYQLGDGGYSRSFTTDNESGNWFNGKTLGIPNKMWTMAAPIAYAAGAGAGVGAAAGEAGGAAAGTGAMGVGAGEAMMGGIEAGAALGDAAALGYGGAAAGTAGAAGLSAGGGGAATGAGGVGGAGAAAAGLSSVAGGAAGGATASNIPAYLAAGNAAVGLAGAAMGADATRSAANTAADAQNNALSVADRNYQQTRQDFMPFYNVGVGAIPDYQKMLRGGYDMKESPAAQYQLQKGTQAMNRALASRGLSGSGNAAQRLTELNQSVAANDWNQQYSRILDALKLGTGASASMGSASQANANANQTAAGALGNIAMQQGANQASLYSGAAGQVLNSAALGLRAYDVYNRQTPSNNYGGAAAANQYGYGSEVSAADLALTGGYT